LVCEKGVRKTACKSFGAHKLWSTAIQPNKLQFILTEVLVWLVQVPWQPVWVTF